MRHVLVLFTLLSLAFAGTALPALGQEVLDAGVTQIDFAPASSGAPTGDAGEYAEAGRVVLEAVDKGDGWMAAALGLSLLVLVIRKASASWLPDGPATGETDAGKATLRMRLGIAKRWIASGEGAIALTLLGAVLSGIVSTMSAGVAPLSWIGIRSVLKVTVAALGGFAGLQHTIGAKAAESRAERREVTDVIKAGAVPAPSAEASP